MAYNQGPPVPPRRPYQQQSQSPYMQQAYTPYEQQVDPSRPSFEEGDDRQRANQYGHVTMPNQEQYMPQGRAYPVQNNYNYGAPSPPATYAAYNPQQYARAGTAPYTAPIQTSPQMTASPTMAPQAYNPAAYASPTNTSGFDWPSYNTTGNSYAPVQPHSGPPVPPRPYEYARVTQNTTATPPSHRPHGSVPITRASTSPQPTYPAAYTPPAPPPPPFLVNSDAPPSPTVSRSPNANTTSSPTHHSTFPARSETSSLNLNHRLPPLPSYPSLPNYGGTGDYSTPTEEENGFKLSPQPSSQSSISGSPAPNPPPHTPQRSNTSNRHPQLRPLPGPPPASYEEAESQEDGEGFGYDDLLDEVEATVMGRTPVTPSSRSPRVESIVANAAGRGSDSPEPLFSGSNRTALSPDVRYSHTNGAGKSSGVESAGIDVNYDAYSDDSDAEAAAGLAAMQMAEEQEAADRLRRNTLTSGHSRQASHAFGENGSVPIDSPAHGGGGTDTTTTLTYRYGDEMASSLSPLDEFGLPPEDSIHPFPSFVARTDTGGSGGLVEPGAHPRRLSFEDGDEATLVDHGDYVDPSSSQTTARSSLRSSTGGPSRHTSRPLPRIPGGDSGVTRRQTDHYPRAAYPQAPDEYEHGYSAAAMAVQKANSVGTHSNTPQIIPPGRSVTDAEQRRRAQFGGHRADDVYDTLSPDSIAAGSNKIGDMLLPTLPSGKRRKFIASKLSSNDFDLCLEPWAQSSILSWLKQMTEGESDLKEQSVLDGLVALFTFKVPTMNTADAEVLSMRLVEQMFQQQALVKDEEWVRFGPGEMSGVLFQLTGTGCYSSRLHNVSTSGRCYSYHCMRTLKKLDLQTQALAPQRAAEGWAEYYGLKKEDVENRPQKEIERQYNLHEIITGEDRYMEDLNVLQILYRDGLANASPPIISPQRLASFVKDVFGKVDAVKQANEEYLLPQLKYRQKEQGPWIKGFSDIFREWSRKARTAYIDYAVSLPSAILRFRKEAEKNVLFKHFLEQVRSNERSRRLELDSFLKAPISRLQRYGLLLQTVLKHTTTEGEEKANLVIAIEEVKNMTLECDTRFAEQSKRADMEDLSYKLVLRPGMEKVQLNLNHLGREIVLKGDLQRRGKGYGWIDIHAILFDHYLVLAKPIQNRDVTGGLRKEVLDVSKLPIPMDLLVLESMNDDPVVKSSVKSVTTLSKPTNPGTRPDTLVHMNTSTSAVSTSSGKSLVTTTVLDSPNERVLYPFKVKHLGKTEVYTLYASTPQNRAEWCDKIIEAKTRHAASLFAQNAEPFKLRVLADTAFGFDAQSGGPRGVVIKGTPLDRAVEECDRSFYGTGARPGPVCRAQVNCATTFNQPYGGRLVAVGTDYGVYISEYGKARNWSRAITATHVTQIAVLEDFSLFIIIAEKQLIAYHLDTVCAVGGAGATTDSRRPPQKLSGNRDVGFFACGRQKDRTLVFYKKKDGISSTFKVLEPVYQKSMTNSRSRFAIRKGPTDFFRDFDEFYIPSETYAINLFQTSVAVSSIRGIEVLTLDKKVTLSIPDLRQPEVAPIAQRIHGQKPLGMFRLSDNEFLLVFEEIGIYVDKHGDVSRAVVMEFVGKAKQACLFASMYLILVDAGSGFVEIRNAVNGRLRQIISGREVRLLDDGASSGTVKICMQHPEQERCQVVLELQVNEGLKE